LLERAGLEDDAREVVLEGADRGIPTEEPIHPGPISYARSLSREKAVQWLTRIQAVRELFQGYWQTSDYGYWASLDDKPVRRALAEMKLKSAIARPRVYDTLLPNQTYTVFGAAWAGETEVTEIAVSTDGGQTWAEGHFFDPARRHAWRLSEILLQELGYIYHIDDLSRDEPFQAGQRQGLRCGALYLAQQRQTQPLSPLLEKRKAVTTVPAS
jgi:DMSO/TMAO reductase YedYZ molybdopterin-dependent catalytic subunit